MDARINLTVGCREGRSYLRNLYVTPPFRVVSVGQLRHDGGAYLMQMSTSPGVLSGDDYLFNIRLEPYARLQLKSQSYMRIFDMDAHATQRINITIEEGGYFSQVSHPIVPHRNSSFSSSTHVEMGCESSFLQSEIITCGRRFHGEEFEFREFSNSVEVRSKGVLRVKDRVWLNPSLTPLRTCGLLEGYTHQGTLIFQTTREGVDVDAYIEQTHKQLEGVKNIDFGLSKSHYCGFVVRVLGESGEALYNLFSQVQELLWDLQNNKTNK